MTINDENKVEILNENNRSFFTWIQTFSKKIVTAFSILYMAVVIALIIMLVYGLRMGFTDGISTMITEINETFRIVIGGYLIKAAIENGFKITGGYFEGINRLKLKLQAKRSGASLDDISLSESEEDESDLEEPEEYGLTDEEIAEMKEFAEKEEVEVQEAKIILAKQS